MKISSKILTGSGIVLSIILCYSFTFGESKDIPQNRDTQERVHYEEAEKIAQDFITTNIGNEFWENEIPTLGEGTPMYMEKDIPSYVEYEILCKKENGCGFIVINVDGDDVKVPKLSLTDIPASKILTQKSGVPKELLKFYYFNPFSIYSENIESGELNMIDPQLDPTEEREIRPEMSDEERNTIKKIINEQKTQLPQLLAKEKDKVVQYKQSKEFQIYKKEIENITPQAPKTWKYVAGNSMSGCNGKVPCYEQFKYNYVKHNTTNLQIETCYTGCLPVAIAIIFGYHDRNGKTNIIKGATAPILNNPTTSDSDRVRHMIAEIRGYVGTYCDGNQGSTIIQATPQSIQYVKAQGYGNSPIPSEISASSTSYYNVLTTEINANRPISIGIKKVSGGGHVIVGQGYSPDTSSGKRAIINAGWGPNDRPNTWLNLTSFSFKSENASSSSEAYTILLSGYTFKIQ